jgi:hypothetical protein
MMKGMAGLSDAIRRTSHRYDGGLGTALPIVVISKITIKNVPVKYVQIHEICSPDSNYASPSISGCTGSAAWFTPK